MLVLAGALGAACSAPQRSIASPSASSPPAADIPGYPFGVSSFWRQSIARAPLDPLSGAQVSYLVGTIVDRYGGVAAFNAHQYSSSTAIAARSTPLVDVAWSNCQGKSGTPAGLLGEGGQFTGVPIPTTAVPASGSDGALTVWSPSTDRLWEFWKARKGSNGAWSACWGGRIDGVSTSPGHFLGDFGGTASGLPHAGGSVRLSEVRAGRIDHAIAISIPSPAVSTNVSWPAQRSDGSDPNVAALPEGSRLRLDPRIDVERLGLSPAALAIARAAQTYGFVVVDRSGSVSVIAEREATVNGVDPWTAFLGGPDYAVLRNFPWSGLQVIQKDWGKPAG